MRFIVLRLPASPESVELQYLVGHFLMLLLVGVACALDEELAVLGGGGHVRVDVTEEAGGIAVSEVIIGADEQGAGVGDLRDLAEVAVGRGVDIIEQSAVYPVIGGADGTLHPAHQQEGQHLGSMATVVELADEFALAGRDAGGHVVKVGGRKQQEVLYARGVVAREVVDDLVGSQRVTGQNDVAVALLGGVVEVGLDVLVGQCKTLVPRADDFLAAGMGVHRSDGPEGVVGLGVDEVDARGGERVADVVVEGVRVEVSVDAGDADEHRVGSSVCGEQHAVEQYASLCFYL